jgi:Lipid A core - O-antigen ligase and related enzymes
MGAACILFAAFALHLNRRRAAVFCGITAIAGWLGTLQSLERAPLIGTVSGLVLLGTVVFIEPSKRLFGRLGILSIILLVVFLLQTLPSRITNNDVSTVTRLSQNLNNDPNTRVRFLFWGVGLELLRAHPVLGVGANNYLVKFGEGRAQFVARYPDSPLVSMNDSLLTLYAHNEYVQIAAELGIVGLILFLLFAVSLVVTFVRRLRHRTRALSVLGPAGALLAFAISSGASASSFRYVGGGLIFFFAAALLNRRVVPQPGSDEPVNNIQVPNATLKYLRVCLLLLMLFSVGLLTAQAVGITLHSWAESSADAAEAERYFRRSLKIYPANSSARFSYGMWLYGKGRSAEATQYLRSAVDRGFNSSICFTYLAGAQSTAGDVAAAEETLAQAVKIYPASMFLLVRHASALERTGHVAEAEAEFSRALTLDSRAARGWRQLIDNDIDAALQAAQQNNSIAMPSELSPESAVLAIMQENERRFPDHVNTGLRARMRLKL